MQIAHGEPFIIVRFKGAGASAVRRSFRWRVPHPWANRVIVGHVDMDLAQNLAITVEKPARCGRCWVRSATYTLPASSVAMLCGVLDVPVRAGSWFSPGLDPVSVFINFRYPGIDVAKSLIYVFSRSVPRHIGHLSKLSADRRPVAASRCFSGPVPSSDASCLRPKTINSGGPPGLIWMTMSDIPLSATQNVVFPVPP